MEVIAMLKTNNLKAKKDTYQLSYVPLIELYQKLCDLEKPYIWYRDGRYKEALYYIEDIWTRCGASGYYYDPIGMELPSGFEERICMELKRIDRNELREIVCSIDYDLCAKRERSIEQFLSESRMRIPSELELLDEQFEEGIPGHITTCEDKIKELSSEIAELSDEIRDLQLSRDVYEEQWKKLNLKLKIYERKIESKQNRIMENKQKIDALMKGR